MKIRCYGCGRKRKMPEGKTQKKFYSFLGARPYCHVSIEVSFDRPICKICCNAAIQGAADSISRNHK